jgi:iron-sulfur cluster repair protein YtfE (RIC family)
LKFRDNVFPPEPSDFPVGIESMAEWEQKLVSKSEKEQESIKDFMETRNALSKMDVPPYNCQSPMIFPMIQRLFNFATDRILLENFVMFDKNGNEYSP